MKRLVIIIIILLSCCAWKANIATTDIKKIEGVPFNTKEQEKIFEDTKKLIELNEGVAFKPYWLKSEYQNINGETQYEKKIIKDKKRKKTIIRYEPKKLYTACYGNTMLLDKNGKFIRFIDKKDRFSKKECDEMFAIQFEKYKNDVYSNMTDKNGANWFNKMLLNEVIIMIDIHWHNGKRGSEKVAGAMINWVKYRTRAGYNRLYNSIFNKTKQSKKYNNFNNRKKRYIKLLIGDTKEILK